MIIYFCNFLSPCLLSIYPPPGYKKLSEDHSRPLAAQKMMFSIKDFVSKCDQIHRKLRIWSHLVKKSLMENYIFCVMSSERLMYVQCPGVNR